MNQKARSRTYAAVIAIAVIVAAAWWWRAHQRPAVAAQNPSPAVNVARVRFGPIEVTVPAVGRLGPAAGAESKLAFATAGRIASIDVHVGERITAGQPLASLDSAPLALVAQQAGADAQMAAAQARGAAVDRLSTKIALDEATVARARRLFAAGVTARKDVEAAQAQVAADRADASGAAASLAAARAQAASAGTKAQMTNRDLSNGTLRSPVDGVVTAVMHSVGESVDPTIPVIAIAPGENSQVALQMAGSDAAKVRAGDSVRLVVPSTGDTIAGRVTGVAGAVDPATQSAQILVSASAPSALSGAAVDAEIVVAHDRGTLVPKSALVADPATGKTLVFIQAKNKDGSVAFQDREVHIIFENAKTAEISGLTPDTPIAATGAFQLLPPANGN